MFLLGPMLSKYHVLKKHRGIFTLFMLLLKICKQDTNKSIPTAIIKTGDKYLLVPLSASQVRLYCNNFVLIQVSSI